MSTVRYFSTIQHNFYQPITDTNFTQKPLYDKVEDWFTVEKRSFSRLQEPKHQNDVIYHKNLHDLFFMLIDPLKSRDEMITEFSVHLDNHKELLKEITHHYKKLQRDILSYMSNKGDDTSYTNEKCMCFWASLLNSRIIIIEKTSFKTYKPSNEDTQTKEFIIRVSEQGFEYMATSLVDFSKKFSTSLHEKVDTTKLNSKSMNELRDLSKKCKIELPSKIKKSELVSKLMEVLI